MIRRVGHWFRPLLPSTPADGAEAFLAGDYAAYADGCGIVIRPWMWLNRVAHSSLDELRRRAVDPVPFPLPDPGPEWREAITRIATHELGLAHGDDAVLREIQQERLIPLELQLVDDPHPLTGGPVASRALAALYRHPSAA